MSEHAKKKSKTQSIELDINEAISIEKRLKGISAGDTISVSTEDEKLFHMAAQLIRTLISIYGMWTNSKKKISKLLKMVFGNRSEKLKDLEGASSGKSNSDSSTSDNKKKDNTNGQNSEVDNLTNGQTPNSGANDKGKEKDKKRQGGGGKNSADDYESAAEITCSLCDNLQPGTLCPKCGKSKLYEIDPKKVIRLVGNAPITAFEFVLQQVRCACGAIFTADVGDEFRDIYEEDKYGPSALAAMIIYKYLMGVSFGTLASIQEMSGVPLPASTQANKIKNDALPAIQAVFGVLKGLVSNANLLGFDDTVIRTLEKRETKDGNGSTHRGHGTAVIANRFDTEDNEIVFFDFNSSKHAGDVVCELLALRDREALPLLISDGLNSYDECKKSGIDINCNTHARRKVVEEDPKRETYVGQSVLDCFSEIYKNDRHCKDNELSTTDRMEHHKEHSSFYFKKIRSIFNIISGVEDNAYIREIYSIPGYLVEDEPNGDLRAVADYFLKRYEALTRVTKIPGVPLDTNYVERIIKVIIRLRKSSLFFNNISSAVYSGEILSLLETAVANGVNVFDYMKFLLANKEAVIKRPHHYLPWPYLWEDREKEAYWKRVEELKKSPSNFFESSPDESCRSSA